MDPAAVALRLLDSSDRQFAWELNQSEVPRVGTETFEEFGRLCEISVSQWLATSGDASIGFLLGMTKDARYESPNFLWFHERYDAFLYVDRLAVVANYRKRGVGAALYARAEADARRLRLPMVCCEVNLRPANPESLAFHQRVGFSPVGEQEVEGKQVVMLVRPLR